MLFVSAPGRICLFGEHQDYLGLPVIAMAVNLRFEIQFEFTDSKTIRISKPDLGPDVVTDFDPYARQPANSEDFCWGIAQVLIEDGFTFPRGGKATFRSRIPLRAGCSSSSAMSAAWMRLLLEIGEHPEKSKYIDHPETSAYAVYRGEKEKFQGAGGMMDQYSCYLGGLIHVFPDSSRPIPYGVEQLPAKLDGIILIDSGDPKDTQGILSSVGDRARKSIEIAANELPEFNLLTSNTAEVEGSIPAEKREKAEWKIAVDHLKNRDLCREGLRMFRNTILPESLGSMLTEEHRILSKTLGISTPRIDWILDLANKAGAAGGKINGSGGGGTCFCYVPDQKARMQVLYTLAENNIRHFEVHSDSGARMDQARTF